MPPSSDACRATLLSNTKTSDTHPCVLACLTGQGILGLVSYMGAANAGVPLSWVVQNHGWNGYFTGEAGGAMLRSWVQTRVLSPLLFSEVLVCRQGSSIGTRAVLACSVARHPTVL